MPSLQIAAPCAGRRDTTDAKIRIDMPLPMPRWVMSSPSHMTIAVPAVHVSTMSAARAGVEVRDHVGALEAREAEQPALALVQREHEAGRLDRPRGRW